MSEDKKAEITIQMRNRIYHIVADEKDAKNILNVFINQDIPATVSVDVSSNSVILPKRPSGKSQLKVPESSLLTKFIKSQFNYRFSIDTLVKQFEGRNSSEFKTKEEINYLNALRAKVFRIRRAIEIAEKGEWVVDYKNHQKAYEFIKDSEVEQNNQDKKLTGDIC